MAMGRPRAFCADKALDRALEVFWRKGYEGASLTELTDAMGINRPSLYAAFGNKEALFRKALDRYVTEKAAYLREALSAPTAREVCERLLLGAAAMLTDPCHPVGCLAVRGALTCGDEAESVKREIAEIRERFDTDFRNRLERGLEDGDLPSGTDIAALARFVSTVIQGMSIQAASGATCEDLRQVAETALVALPRQPATAEPAE
ncbi:MAG: TetR/AcrR family transcriptional regulator [Magnetospirillum sp.]|nr:TetR/AcrR family transcriptional regulator [Magnetospirillum sp.]